MINTGFQRGFAALLLAVLHPCGVEAQVETAIIPASADTALHEFFPGNNFGAFNFVHGGETAKATATRGLYRFDLSSIPAGAEVISVKVELTVVFSAPGTGAAEADFALHRMLTGWGEGNKNAGAGLGGRPATDGEASWNHARRPAAWGTPGGQPGVDYEAEASASIGLLGTGAHEIASTAELLSDVAVWLERPEENFGWMLKAGNESGLQTARRFGSREGGQPARLVVEYRPAAAPPVFTSIRVEDGIAVLEWEGGTSPWQLQRSGAIGEGWENAGPPLEAPRAEVPATGNLGWFRLAVPPPEGEGTN